MSIGAFLDVLKPDRCLVPLGVKHPDHIQTGQTGRRALAARKGIEAIIHADLPYRFVYETDYDAVRDHQVPAEGFRLTDDFERDMPSTNQPKLDAAMRYDSQQWRFDRQAWEKSMKLGAEVFWHLRAADA